MTDIFFSYKSDDRERVRPVRDAFAALGFDVFWDQQVPAGVDWDTWIRRHLAEAKCAIVFWSVSSAASDNVRHEATVAKQQGKLIAALLEPLTAAQFPMGMYSQQAANLVDWRGDLNDAAWGNLLREVETKLVPRWMQQRIDELEAELIAERGRREGAENRNKVLRAQIAKEAQGDEDLRHERDKAIDEVTALRTAVHGLNLSLSQAEERTAQETRRANEADSRRQALEQQLGAALARVAKAEHHSDARYYPRTTRNPLYARIRLALSMIGLITFLSTAVWAYLSWPMKTNINEAALPITANPESPTRGRTLDPTGLSRLPSEPTSDSVRDAVISVASGSFTIKKQVEVIGDLSASFPAVSTDACAQRCADSAACSLFSVSERMCFLYRTGTLQPSRVFDSGIRNIPTTPSSVTGVFTVVNDTEAIGAFTESFATKFRTDCEERCAKSTACKIFTYG